MPNFNGVIIMHALEKLKQPSTYSEVLAIISENTQLEEELLRGPVRQTLEIGCRYGFLQKANARYFLMPMTFSMLMSGTQNETQQNSYTNTSLSTNFSINTNSTRSTIGKPARSAKFAKFEVQMAPEPKPKRKISKSKQWSVK